MLQRLATWDVSLTAAPISSATSHPWYQLIVTCSTLSTGLQFQLSGSSWASKTPSSGHVCYCSKYSVVAHSQWTEAPLVLLVLPQTGSSLSDPCSSTFSQRHFSFSPYQSLGLSARWLGVSSRICLCWAQESGLSLHPGQGIAFSWEPPRVLSPLLILLPTSSSWPGGSWGLVTWFQTLTRCLGHCCLCSVHFHEPAVLCRQNHLHVSLSFPCLPTFRTQIL